MRPPPSPSPFALSLGNELGPYKLGRVLGEGATGVVFHATRLDDESEVALKVLRTELADDSVYRRRLAHEVRAASEVVDRHVVPIVDFGEASGRPYIAFEYIEGSRSLRNRIREEGPLPPADAIRLARRLGSGIDALHALQILHRDIKPGNIILTREGDARLTDFGLARGPAYTVLTRPGQVLGTVEYIAPELIVGEPATGASDIYSFGCTMFECMTGAPPFSGRGLIGIGVAHLEEAPPDPSVGHPELGGNLAVALLQALEKKPADRPATATAYATMLYFAWEGGRL